jgi:8-oxo-dGTP pyrophosphatase MutT (NUDIX family)
MPSPSTSASVGLLLIDHRGWILLQLRDAHGTYPDHWSTVGGALEPGKTIEEALVREVYEETGYRLSHPVTIGSEGAVQQPDGRTRCVFVSHPWRGCSPHSGQGPPCLRRRRSRYMLYF